MKQRLVSKHLVQWDSRTVWVTAPDGGTVARFGRFGVDLHNTLEEQQATGRQCLDCTHGEPNEADWLRFREGLVTHYGVRLPAACKPIWLAP